MQNIHYSNTDHTGLERIRELWTQLNKHHASISTHFPHKFEAGSFDARKQELLEAAKNGELFIALAMDGDIDVGYCAASCAADGAGEIVSIFLSPEYRGRNVAHTLMNMCLEWLDKNNAEPVTINVVHGNERAHSFYSRFGFQPASVRLDLKK